MPRPTKQLGTTSRASYETRLGLLSSVVIFNVVLSTAYQDALFLANHDRGAIPPAMFFGSLVTAAATLVSARVLRRFAPHLDHGGSALFFRVVELTAVVLAIAVLSIAFVYVDMLVLILLSYAWLVGAA